MKKILIFIVILLYCSGSVSARQRNIPGDTWTEPVTGMEFIWVPGGCFQMGSNLGDVNVRAADEKPVHKVCLDGFWMGKYEVTQGQWKKIMGTNPSSFQYGDDFPVERVSFDDVQLYILKFSQQSANRFSLPSEAQWEYAARSGGRDQTYAGGDDLDGVAWYDSNSGSKTHSVGTKSPNDLGIHDMSGNVCEWCEDVYDANAYSKHDRNNPVITYSSFYRVIRGGSWRFNPWIVRTAYRDWFADESRLNILGFRLCLPQVGQ